MEGEKGRQPTTGGRRRCGYQYMLPSYVDLDDSSDNYLVVADALLENSSAHGLPTFYRARGLTFSHPFYRVMLYIRGTSHGPLSVCVRLSQVGVLSKRMDESSWILAHELPSTHPTLC